MLLNESNLQMNLKASECPFENPQNFDEMMGLTRAHIFDRYPKDIPLKMTCGIAHLTKFDEVIRSIPDDEPFRLGDTYKNVGSAVGKRAFRLLFYYQCSFPQLQKAYKVWYGYDLHRNASRGATVNFVNRVLHKCIEMGAIELYNDYKNTYKMIGKKYPNYFEDTRKIFDAKNGAQTYKKKYETPAELYEALSGYFKTCFGTDDDGNKVMKRTPTLAGIRTHIGLSRGGWKLYKDNEVFSDIINLVYDVLDAYASEELMTPGSNVAGIKFVLNTQRRENWQEVAEVINKNVEYEIAL